MESIGRRLALKKLIDQFFPIAIIPLLLLNQRHMLDNQLGGHFDQFCTGANLVRIAGDTEYAERLFAKDNRQVYAGLHALQAAGHGGINLNRSMIF